jgi:hypothetical protein
MVLELEQESFCVVATDLHRVHGDLVMTRGSILDLSRGCHQLCAPHQCERGIVQLRLNDVDLRSAGNGPCLKSRPPARGPQGGDTGGEGGRGGDERVW